MAMNMARNCNSLLARAQAPSWAVSTALRCTATQSRNMSQVSYRSTRGGMKGLRFDQAVLQGLASDKGLLVPEKFPTFPEGAPWIWKDLSYPELAYEITSLYIPEDVVPAADLKGLINKSYSTFRDTDVTPCVPIKDEYYALELFHGPTFAFKDVALQLLGNMFEYLLAKNGNMHLTVVGATSGDTGSSAIHGLRGKKGVDCFILYPDGRTSPIQEQQMITVLDENIHSLALAGSFDDCQAIVKDCFNDPMMRENYNLGAVNSINWCRILAQTVYYVWAYLKVAPEPTAANPAPKVSFSVPTGNFGDILAGYYAKIMGLPVDDMVVATNSNDVLDRFFKTGTYDNQGVQQTITPSMDIAISSNFERFLFHMTGDDTAKMNQLMATFEETGTLVADADMYKNCTTEMSSARVDDAEILECIKEVHSATGYTLDPHSAIGVAAAKKVGTNPEVPMICLACAHWAKFPKAVNNAVGDEAFANLETPEILASLASMETRKNALPATTAAVQDFIKKTVG